MKTALITGANKGIGREVARQLAAKGFHVFVGARNAKAGSKAARVINVSSGGGQLTGGADGWSPAYCISKTALNGVTVQLAAALPKFAVNSVCPGWVRTEMAAKMRAAQWRKARTRLCGSPA